uniref:Ig-like domain-containing protein n=1 Tax=Heligmosomoides polygyrus TaxID=6339 RepID=A0A8L8JZV0_HELPZ
LKMVETHIKAQGNEISVTCNIFGLQNKLWDFQVAPQYRLGLCTVPKIMSTINLAIFCFLKHPKRYMVEKRQISKEMSWPRSSRISLRFSVIRHPIDRFLSAYTDKCLDCTHLCYGCGTDINCFIERFNSKIRYYARHSFHYLDELTYHLAPLNWWEIFSSLFWCRSCICRIFQRN